MWSNTWSIIAQCASKNRAWGRGNNQLLHERILMKSSWWPHVLTFKCKHNLVHRDGWKSSHPNFTMPTVLLMLCIERKQFLQVYKKSPVVKLIPSELSMPIVPLYTIAMYLLHVLLAIPTTPKPATSKEGLLSIGHICVSKISSEHIQRPVFLVRKCFCQLVWFIHIYDSFFELVCVNFTLDLLTPWTASQITKTVRCQFDCI